MSAAAICPDSLLTHLLRLSLSVPVARQKVSLHLPPLAGATRTAGASQRWRKRRPFFRKSNDEGGSNSEDESNDDQTNESEGVASTGASADQCMLLTGDDSGCILLWTSEDGQSDVRGSCTGHTTEVREICFLAPFLAAASVDIEVSGEESLSLRADKFC